MNSSITFDDLNVRIYVARKQRAALVSSFEGAHLGYLLRVEGCNHRTMPLLWQPNPHLSNPPPCPLEVFETVATMI